MYFESYKSYLLLQMICEHIGGHLVEIADEREGQYLLSMMANMGGNKKLLYDCGICFITKICI